MELKERSEKRLKKQIRRRLLLFIIALVVSGITASFLETELNWIMDLLPGNSQLSQWLLASLDGISYLNAEYPQLAYGFDWLAFGHLVIAGFFIGPLRDPVRNKWVIIYGIIVCLAVFPLAFFAGYFREIPFYWQLIDCSFGVLGMALLINIYNKILKLQTIQLTSQKLKS